MKQKDITYVPGFLELDVSKAVEKMGRSGASNLVMSAVLFWRVSRMSFCEFHVRRRIPYFVN